MKVLEAIENLRSLGDAVANHNIGNWLCNGCAEKAIKACYLTYLLLQCDRMFFFKFYTDSDNFIPKFLQKMQFSVQYVIVILLCTSILM